MTFLIFCLKYSKTFLVRVILFKLFYIYGINIVRDSNLEHFKINKTYNNYIRNQMSSLDIVMVYFDYLFLKVNLSSLSNIRYFTENFMFV